ncbi:SAGA-associated factor 29-like protein [Dinothrombium tinctorium]|uniref:SAGA-associated factor 29-like protein n=1 Tax=Dinothrombium tinctorium TaxID=1965070 RepID=A0A3S3NSE5_9ACAR|nr:SAGA-associated factor 29-like protein [Dinothrombium tinctorium]RWS05105.1 SAGA-associated factor 29-like protein [Dinothrombium tinctorium]RWS05754.1 SAGA-associated factor 29-like protein [Dinothrombium tinctorium]
MLKASEGSSSGPLAANSEISEKLRELFALIHNCHEERTRSEHNLTNIAKTHERMQSEPSKPYYKQKLKGLYKTALQDATSEEEIIRKCLDLIFEIRNIIKNRPRKTGLGFNKETAIRRGALMKMLQQSALTLPLFIGKRKEERAPPLCGAISAEPNYVGKVGDMVAALVRSADGDENWILAEIVHYNHNTSKYEIDDIDEEQKERHTLSRRRIVPLPLMRANPETNSEALFAKGTLVLALYPQTTCFYRAVIQEPPKGPEDEYQVLFEDSSYADGYSPPLSVPQRYVILSRELRKK